MCIRVEASMGVRSWGISEVIPGVVSGVTYRGHRFPESLGSYLSSDATVVTMDQVHGDHCSVVSRDEMGGRESLHLPASDACILDCKGGVIGVRTADCLPVLIYHPSVIAGVHAGRKGTELGITATTLRLMMDRYGVSDDVVVYFGPAICRKCYQIDRELDLYFDLAAQNTAQIRELLSSDQCRIIESHLCTVEHPSQFDSYRRDGSASGRFYTFVQL